MKPYYFLFILIFFSCNSLQYTNTTIKELPELGTIGVYSNYLLDSDHLPKTIVSLKNPIRLKVQEIKVEKRAIFKGNDSLQTSKKDSTLVSIEILDNIALIRQLNEDKELLEYLKKGEDYSIVTKSIIYFPISILQNFSKADEYYLIRNKEKTLSIELRKDNKQLEIIEFSDGKILAIKVSEFCWGQNKKRKIEIFDIVPKGSSCNKNTYKSAQKAKKKNEFKF